MAGDAHLDPDAIRVLSWNVYKGSLEGWRRDFGRLAGEHDLLLLQEAYWDAETKPVLAELEGFGWWLGVTFEYALAAGQTGTMIGSRCRTLAPIVFRHSPHREALVNTPKSHIAGLFEIEGSSLPLLAVSVHGINLRLQAHPFEAHMDQVMETVASHRGPVVLAGDFNTWSAGRTAYLFEGADALGLKSVYDRAPAGEGDGRTTWGDHYLDHAFVRGLELRGEPKVLAEVRSSDHSALSFEVALAK